MKRTLVTCDVCGRDCTHDRNSTNVGAVKLDLSKAMGIQRDWAFNDVCWHCARTIADSITGAINRCQSQEMPF